MFHTFFSVSIVDFEYLNVCQEALSRGKYHYPKSKDQQMLYLTSFKLQQIFSIAKFSKFLTTSSLSLSML